jgi:DNA-binding FadR family transcriptional regulator
MGTLGAMIIPRSRLERPAAARNASSKNTPSNDERRQYLRRVNAEHESIFDAIVNQDTEGARAAMRTHLANSRERRRRANAELAK